DLLVAEQDKGQQQPVDKEQPKQTSPSEKPDVDSPEKQQDKQVS
ncbi:unnamed protein product, partial [marine sediment metagenome]